MKRREIKIRIRAALAEADPIGTELSLEERLDEYSLEAGEIARKISRGEPLDKAVVAVFRDTCGLELGRGKVSEIVAGYQSGPEVPAD